MRHTKGPWAADGADILAGETRFRGKDEPLATLNVESSNWVSDAALIAAAPDMLEALKLAQKYLTKMVAENIECVVPPQRALDIITANIARAEGQAS